MIWLNVFIAVTLSVSLIGACIEAHDEAWAVRDARGKLREFELRCLRKRAELEALRGKSNG